MSDLAATLLKEEQAHTHTIEQRDHAEDTINAIYGAVMGYSPEWSNHYQFSDAVRDIEERVMDLESEIATLRLALGLCPAAQS